MGVIADIVAIVGAVLCVARKLKEETQCKVEGNTGETWRASRGTFDERSAKIL